MKADVWWVVGGAALVLALVVGVLVDRYLSAVWNWPLVGSEWRERRRPAPHQPGSPSYPPGSPFYDPDEEFCEDCHTLCTEDRPCSCCYVEREESEDESWADQLHDINTALHEEGEQAAPGGHPIYAELSDDPDLIVWDAAQQAKRCWEIVHIEFPRLRTQLLAEYAVAA